MPATGNHSGCRIFRFVMPQFNSYLDKIDLAALRDYCMEHGQSRSYSKGECFVSEGSTGHYFAVVSDGYFKYTITDSDGNIAVGGFAFTGEFVGDFYNSYNGDQSMVSIIAGNRAEVFMITFSELKEWCRGNMPDFVPALSGALFRMLYERYIDSYRKTPKERYMDFIKAYPDVLQVITLKDLASYLHITPIYLSRLRKEVHHQIKAV